MVDWSAASRPGPAAETKDQIWIAWGTHHSRPSPLYCRTRQAAFEHLHALLAECRGNALIGFDFPNAYPAGSGLSGGRALAARLAELIEDDPDNRNNRFAVARQLNRALGAPPGPFWMCPQKEADRALTVTRPGFEGRGYGEYRLVERRLRAAKKYPHSVWKLYGAGSVGSQTLLGMPVVHRLLNAPALVVRSRIWPFETNWNERLSGIVHAEIWPSLFSLDGQNHPIKDARQVMAVRGTLLAEDLSGALRRRLARPESLSAVDNRIALAEEGWILGVD